LSSPAAFAQAASAKQVSDKTAEKPVSASTPAKPSSDVLCARPNYETLPERTFYLHNASQVSDANEIHTAIRNMLPPDARTYLVPSKNAIIVRGTAEQLTLVQKIIDELDRPKKSYRLTYTVTETDADKTVTTERFSLNLTDGQQATLKQGRKVPITTGSYNAVATDKNPAGAETQYTYLDVGMNFDATLFEMGDQVMLRSNVEQSSIAPEQSGVGPQDPIVIQSMVKSTILVTPNKPQSLGSIAIPHSTRHLDIAIVLEPLS
jgi:type II secretory pathway component GspD/PulD (secretin)